MKDLKTVYTDNTGKEVFLDKGRARKNVAEYLKELIKYDGIEAIAPLMFSDDNKYIPEVLGKNKPLGERIMYVLYYTTMHDSINCETDDTETESYRDRSALDIWRHLRYYDKTLSIFTVMREIHSLVFKNYDIVGEKENCILPDSQIVGHYCGTIRRQVFTTREIKNGYKMYVGNTTEFGIYLCEWGLL